MTTEDKRSEEWKAASAKRRQERQRLAESAPAMASEEFLAWRSPRIGTDNPTRLDNPLWQWLVRTRWSAFQANEIFKGPSPLDAGPMWCFDRFGKSETLLPDGRVVHIGGEHEDFYDQNFFIYNDVTVLSPDGDIAIHGYPREVFPPTDFHSATLADGNIVVIGRLGYREQRKAGITPVFRLDLQTMQFAAVETHGEAPGWLHRHDAALADDGRSIVVRGGDLWLSEARTMPENTDRWSLDLATGRWTRLTALEWQAGER